MLATKFRFIWLSGFRGEDFLKSANQKKNNCLWRPCLLMDRDRMCNLQRETSIDASYQGSVHLAEGFQRRRLKCEKITADGRRTPSDDKSSHCLWQSELKMKCHKILHVPSAHNRHKNFLRHMKLFSVRTKHLTSAHNMNI